MNVAELEAAIAALWPDSGDRSAAQFGVGHDLIRLHGPSPDELPEGSCIPDPDYSVEDYVAGEPERMLLAACPAVWFDPGAEAWFGYA